MEIKSVKSYKQVKPYAVDKVDLGLAIVSGITVFVIGLCIGAVLVS